MAQVYTVTASTSVVQITSLQAPNTVVLLSSISYPGHIVGIRDATGSNAIAANPIIISTMQGLQFYDGTSSILLNQPNGYISLSSRNPTTWQVLNTQGFLNILSNGYLQTLTTQYAFPRLVSTMLDYVSSSVAGSLNVTNTLVLQGTTDIGGNLTVTGEATFFSTLRVYGELNLSSGLVVSKEVLTTSSLAIGGNLTVGGTLSTLSTFTAQQDLQIGGSLTAGQLLVPRFLSVQTLNMQTLTNAGGVQIADGISSLGSANIGQDLHVQGRATVRSSAVAIATTAVGGYLDLSGNLQTQTLWSQGPSVVLQSSLVKGTTTLYGTVSTQKGLVATASATSLASTLVYGHTNVSGITTLGNLTVQGSATLYDLNASCNVFIGGNASAYGSTLTVQTSFAVQGAVGVGGSGYGGSAFVSGPISTLNVSAGDFVTPSTLSTVYASLLGNLTVGSTFTTGYLSTSGNASAVGDFVVQGGFHLKQILAASTLGAPIDLSISTLTLSNTFFVGARGKVPLLDIGGTPDRLVVGPVSNAASGVNVQGLLQANEVRQTDSFGDPTLWTATQVNASTLLATTLLSSVTLGETDFVKPLQTATGIVVTGSNASGNNLLYSLNVSTSYVTSQGTFATSGIKVRSDGSTTWVAVGNGGSAAASIKRSLGGFTWSNCTSGGFATAGNGLVYGGGRWVAVGQATAPAATIQVSLDGLSWVNATGAVFSATSGYGCNVAYNGSNLWVAVGNDPGPPAPSLGIRYSGNGSLWSNATLTPPLFVLGSAVGFGNNLWLVSDGITNTASSTNGSNFTYIATAPGRRCFLYTGTFWLGGGLATSGNPLFSIQYSPNGSNWLPITSGGFLSACLDIQYNPQSNLFVATGDNGLPTANSVQYSSDGLNWFPANSYFGVSRSLAFGTLIVPIQTSLFAANMTSIFRSTLSSVVMTACNVTASSIQATFTGDGSLLSNLTTFSPAIATSTVEDRIIWTRDISTLIGSTTTTTVKDSLTILKNTFLSSTNLYVAAGTDSQTNGAIQTSKTGSNWIRGIGGSFEYYGNAVLGNSNISSQFYVAVGADALTEYTIQWSLDGRTWNPAASGGFDVLTNEIKEGTSVAYNISSGRWVVGGSALGTTSTIFYSSDGKNWQASSNAFSDTATVFGSSNGFVAINGSQGVRYSGTGITWSNITNTSLRLQTLGFGRVRYGLFDYQGWLGTSNTRLYSSSDSINWLDVGTNINLAPTAMAYGNNLWIAVASNFIQASSNGSQWSNVFLVTPDIQFNSVTYNANQGLWIAGASAPTPEQTLLRSSNGLIWLQSQTGGFSTSILGLGAGYGIFTSSIVTLAVGKGGFTQITPIKPAILRLSTTGSSGSFVTEFSLTSSNASNVFSTVVRGIGFETSNVGPYKFVAVGDGETPQKTIARSSNAAAGSWLPAITGGFSTTGYGVSYVNNKWIAVGDSFTSSATIQYSADGANWFATNTAGGIRQGGRAIARGIEAFSSILIAVGKDVNYSTIVYTSTGTSWTTVIGSYFNVQGNGVIGGSNTVSTNFVAVGQDTRGSLSTILRSDTGLVWSNVLTGGFSGGGYGVAYAQVGGLPYYVAVGSDTNVNKTIQYSVDGGANFNGITSGGFTGAGYGVAWNPQSNLFFAVGEDATGTPERTIKFSGDVTNWSNISSLNSGFFSQKTFGAARGVFGQGVLTEETIPYVQFSNLVIYERDSPLFYGNPTIRLQSSYTMFNEAMLVNTSSQIVINSNAPYSPMTALTVNGDIYVSSFINSATVSLGNSLWVSSLIVSSLSSFTSLQSYGFALPTLKMNLGESRPNLMSTTYSSILFQGSYQQSRLLTVNNTLHVTGDLATNQVGIRKPPAYQLDVLGTFATSSFSTSYLNATTSSFITTTSLQRFLEAPNLELTRTTPSQDLFQNSIQTGPSSLIFNNVLSVNLSTQRVGVYTTLPEFDLDVRRHGTLFTVSTNLVRTSLLFLTLQSV